MVWVCLSWKNACLVFTNLWVRSPYHINWSWWWVPVIPTVRKWVQEDWKLNIILDYWMMPACTIWDPSSKHICVSVCVYMYTYIYDEDWERQPTHRHTHPYLYVSAIYHRSWGLEGEIERGREGEEEEEEDGERLWPTKAFVYDQNAW